MLVLDMSKSNEKKFRFGILDLVIILVILAVVVSLVLRYAFDNNLFSYNTEKYTVTIKACGVNYTSVDSIASASEFYIGNAELLGISKHAPTVTPMLTYVANRSGELVPCYYPDNTLVDIVVEIECDLINKNGTLMTKSGVHIAPGVKLAIHTDFVDLNVEIVNTQELMTE